MGPLNRDLTRMLTSIQSGDNRPSDTMKQAVEVKLKALEEKLAAWHELAKGL